MTWIIELDDGKIYRKTLYLMVKTMVSCRFSLKPIQRLDDNWGCSHDCSQAGPLLLSGCSNRLASEDAQVRAVAPWRSRLLVGQNSRVTASPMEKNDGFMMFNLEHIGYSMGNSMEFR